MLGCLWHRQPALPTQEEAYDFFTRVWEVWECDAEKEEKKLKKKPTADAEPEGDAAGDATQPAEAVAGTAEVYFCILPAVRFLTRTFRNVLYVRVGKLIVRLWRSQRSRTVV